MKIILASLFLFAQVIINIDARTIWTYGHWTSWDAPVLEVCANGRSISRIESQHNNGREDRIWKYQCRKDPKISSSCVWTGWLNWFDHEILYQCPNGVITGVNSIHHNHFEDRRFKFRCCKTTRNCQRNCRWTNYVNNWDGRMDYRVPKGFFLTGVKSHHDNGREDRRWQFLICQHA